MPISTDARSLRAQEDGSIKTDFSINQEIKGRKRSWHDFELNALTCEVSTTQAPTDEGASSEQHVLVDIDLKTQKPLSFVIGENDLSGSIVFSRIDHASLARVVSDVTLGHDTAVSGKCAYDVTVAFFGALPLRHRGTHAFDLSELLRGGLGSPVGAMITSEKRDAEADAAEGTALVCVALPTVWESASAF